MIYGADAQVYRRILRHAFICCDRSKHVVMMDHADLPDLLVYFDDEALRLSL